MQISKQPTKLKKIVLIIGYHVTLMKCCLTAIIFNPHKVMLIMVIIMVLRRPSDNIVIAKMPCIDNQLQKKYKGVAINRMRKICPAQERLVLSE